MNWGNAVGKIFDWVPGRKEYYLKKKARLKDEMDKMLVDPEMSTSRFRELADKLREIEQAIDRI